MNSDDPATRDILRRAMVARIGTLSSTGRPSINPLYFVCQSGCIWLGTSEWTLAARNVKADPRVSILFEVERDRSPRRVLRIRGQAIVRTDPQAQRSYAWRVARKYVLTPGGMRNNLAHLRQLPLRRPYAAQSLARGLACVIEVTPLQAEWL